MPSTPGSLLLDQNLNFVQNPVPAGNRRKLTCREANDARFCTMLRYPMENAFAAIEQYRIAFERVTDTHYLNKIGEEYLPECPDIPKIQMIYNNIACMVNRNHALFARNMSNYDLPDGMTDFDFGRLMWG